MKRKSEKADIEWYDFVLQEQLKYLMYIDRSLRGDTKKDKFIDELKPKYCTRFKRKTKINYFIGITVKGRKFIIHAEYFDAKNVFSRPFI